MWVDYCLCFIYGDFPLNLLTSDFNQEIRHTKNIYTLRPNCYRPVGGYGKYWNLERVMAD